MDNEVRIRGELTDSQLLAEYRRTGDGEYFGEIFQRYKQRIYLRCLRLFNGDHGLAEETAQDTFTRALEKVHLCPIENVQSWLYEVAKNLGIDKIRRLKSSALDHSPPTSQAPLSVAGTTLESLEKDTYIQELRQMIEQLNDKQRICLKLAYVDGCSYQEICRLTNYTEKEVKSAIQAGRENLKKKLISNKG